MNEIVLLITIAILLIGGSFISNQVTTPFNIYIRIGAATCLILVLWLTYKNEHLPWRGILTILCIRSIWKDGLLLKQTGKKRK